jgi:putative SOS response-associated peptidase YedK
MVIGRVETMDSKPACRNARKHPRYLIGAEGVYEPKDAQTAAAQGVEAATGLA